MRHTTCVWHCIGPMVCAGVLALTWPAAAAAPRTRGHGKRREIEAPEIQGSDAAGQRASSAREGSGDPDLPDDIETDKSEYLQRRARYVQLRRGLPVPPGKENARSDAIRQMEAQEMKLYGKRALSEYAPATRKALLNSTTWSPVGPAPIPNGQTEGTSVAVSGRVSCLAVHPTNPNIVYAGTAGGGLYRTLDGGTSWTAMMDGALSMAIGAVAIDPLNPSTIIVGTGEASSGGDFFGVGLYKITNADGVMPVVTGPYNLNASASDVFTRNSISQVLVSPTNDNIVFVSTAYGTGGRSGSYDVPIPRPGLYRSTNFLSASPVFSLIPAATANGGSRPVSDMIFDPSDPNTILMNVRGYANANGLLDGGFYRITNALGPTPAVAQVLNIGGYLNARFAANKTGSAVTFLAATEESNCPNGNGGTLRRSTDGGFTWPTTVAAASGFCGQQCWFDIGLAVDPTSAFNILLGGQGSFAPFGPCAASVGMKSIDGGTSFVRADQTLHADVHAIAYAPSNPLIVYNGNDGGIFKSTDGGGTWTSLNNSGFSATQFYSFASHPLDRTFGIGGTQDNGTGLIHEDGSWTHAAHGDGGFTLIDRNAGDSNPLLMYHTYFNQTNALILFDRVTRGSDAVPDRWLGLGYGGLANGIGNDPAVLFFAPMALGPGNPSTLYFGTDRLYRSSNAGLNMSVISQAPIFSGGHVITAIAVSPKDDNVRVVGMDEGSVFVTTTGSSTLTNITSPSLPVAFTADVAVDPNDSKVVYVAYSAFGLAAGQHIWKNANIAAGSGGWAASGSGIPDVPVNALVIDPRNSNNLWAGTDIGVYASSDGGASWNPFGTGLPRVPIFDLDIQEQSRVLRAATHGRGIWEISIPGNVTAALSVGVISTLSNSGNGNGNGFLDPGESGSVTVQVVNHGIATATGVTATISTSTAGVTLLTPAVALPDIAAAGSASNSTPLGFAVAANVACGTVLNFTVTVNATGLAFPLSQAFRAVLGAASGSPMTVSYAGSPVAIPDNDVNGVLVPLAVSGVGAPVGKVTLTIGGSTCSATAGATTVGIDHTWAGNLQLSLISPSGKVVQLSVNRGGSGNNLCKTVFDDAAATAFEDVTYAQAPFTGSFRPIAPLSAFAGENANGTWTLKAVDGWAADTGSVRSFSLTITPMVCTPFVASPSNFAASATSDTAVSVNWNTVAGADHYEIYRGDALTSVVSLTTVAAPPYPDSGLTAGKTYLYKVRAIGGATLSGFTALDPATTIPFNDDPILPGSTIIRASHILQLRQAVNAMRVATLLGTITFTNSAASGLPIQASDIAALRAALAPARAALGLTTTFTDDPLINGSTVIRAVHIQEIRDDLK